MVNVKNEYRTFHNILVVHGIVTHNLRPDWQLILSQHWLLVVKVLLIFKKRHSWQRLMRIDGKVQGWPCRGLLYDTRGSSDRGDFFLEKLMIRVIFRPAAKAPRLTLPVSKYEKYEWLFFYRPTMARGLMNCYVLKSCSLLLLFFSFVHLICSTHTGVSLVESKHAKWYPVQHGGGQMLHQHLDR